MIVISRTELAALIIWAWLHNESYQPHSQQQLIVLCKTIQDYDKAALETMLAELEAGMDEMLVESLNGEIHIPSQP